MNKVTSPCCLDLGTYSQCSLKPIQTKNATYFTFSMKKLENLGNIYFLLKSLENKPYVWFYEIRDFDVKEVQVVY